MTQEEELIYCPNCGLQQRLEGVCCVRCNVNVFTLKIATPEPMVCPECGTIRQASYCVSCGCNLIFKSQYNTYKIKKNLIGIGKWGGGVGVVILSGFILFSVFRSGKTVPGQNPLINVPKGIEKRKMLEDAGEKEKAISSKETYQKQSATSPGTKEYSDAEKQQVDDWLNKFLPMLQKKGLITRIDDTEKYTLFVSDEWGQLSRENKNKILENTIFAIKFFSNDLQVIIKDDSTGDILAESGDGGIVLYR